MSTVSITAHPIGRGTVVVDGHDLSRGVRSLTLDMEAGSLPTVSLELAVFDVAEFEGDARILIPDSTVDALKALGWTPPAEAAS